MTLQVAELALREHWTSVLGAEDYFKEYAARLRREPKQDVCSTLLALTDPDGAPRVSDATALVNLPNLIAAGHDTTANLIAQRVVLLCNNPAQRQSLQNDMSLLPQAVQETLRMRGSALGNLRRVQNDTVIRGVPHVGTADRKSKHGSSHSRL